MAYSQTPDNLFSGMSVDATNLTIPLAALAAHGVTQANADPVTGDPRVLSHALVSRIREWVDDLAVADRPLAVTSATSMLPQASGSFDAKVKTTYKLTFYLDMPEYQVADEPV